MEAFLREALPTVLPTDCNFQVYPFEGKKALLRNLDNRLRGYARWLPPDFRIIILIDRDREDCHNLKRTLESAVARARLRSRSTANAGDWQVATRVVIEELEAWYFGDWDAVKAAYPGVGGDLPRRYRDPDAVTGGTWEAFERMLQRAGYFKGGLRKMEVAQAVGQHIDPHRNTSHSFTVFHDAILEAVAST